MKFAHLGDCHLGGWHQPELKELNFQSFREALSRCKKERVDFILISGDLFDSAYPPIDTLKQTFEEFRKLKEEKINVYLIAGSHDYSVSGKTFLDVLEKSGFAKNVSHFEEKNNQLILEPTLHENIAIYGYPGKKSGLEVDELKNVKIHDSPGMFKILMLHTTIKDAIGNIPVNSVDDEKLPKVDYLALSHLHINYVKPGRAYSGPIFPNNLSELEELEGGTFCVFENGKIRREEIKIKKILPIHLEITNALIATENILTLLENEELEDKIIIVRLSGILEKGKISDIDFPRIEEFVKNKNAYVFLKSTSKLHTEDSEIQIDTANTEQIESKIIKNFEEKNPNTFNSLIPELIRSLSIEKLEDETASTFEDRLFSDIKRFINYEI